MSSSAAGNVDFEAVREMVHKLDDNDKLKIFEELEGTVRRKRLKTVIDKIRKRAAQSPISEEEIRRECEAVREEIYHREQPERSR